LVVAVGIGVGVAVGEQAASITKKNAKSNMRAAKSEDIVASFGGQ